MTQTINYVRTGDIFSTSWGYGQTNVDFYQVVKINSKHFVTVRKIKQEIDYTGDMCGKTIGLKDHFLDSDESRVKVMTSTYNGVNEPYFREPEYKQYRARVWDGKPKYTSSYH